MKTLKLLNKLFLFFFLIFNLIFASLKAEEEAIRQAIRYCDELGKTDISEPLRDQIGSQFNVSNWVIGKLGWYIFTASLGGCLVFDKDKTFISKVLSR